MFAATLGGEWRSAAASDPLGRVVEARYLVLEDGTAVVEAAEAVGLARLAEERARPAASRRAAGSESSCSPLPARHGRSDPRRARRFGDGRRRRRSARGRGRRSGRPRASGSLRRAQPAARRAWRRACLRSPERRLAGAGRGARGPARGNGRASTLRRPGRRGRGRWARRSDRLARRRARLGSALVLERIGFRQLVAGADLVVTGEGTIDRFEPGRQGGRRGGSDLRGGRVSAAPPSAGWWTRLCPESRPHALSGDPERAARRPRGARRAVSRRAARTPRSTLRHHLEHLPGEVGVLLDEGLELPRRDPVALERRLGRDRRSPRAVVDERDFAEVVPVLEGLQVLALDADRRLALVDDEEADPACPSLAIVSPASKVRSFIELARPWMSLLSRPEKSGTCWMSSCEAAMARILSRLGVGG